MAGLFPGIHYTGILPGAGLALLAAAALLAVAGRTGASRRLAVIASSILVAGWLVYEIPFIVLDYSLHEVYWNTSPGLPLWMRIASAWAGGGGSLYLFTVIAALGFLLAARRLEDRKLLATYSALQVGVLLAAYFNDAFTLLEEVPPSGAGLNPLLKSPWLYPHPLTTFGGYALLAVGGLMGLFAPRRAPRWGAVYGAGWALLTLGIMLGGLWSYETFGWGGYWAWDPVETSELMVWLVATTYFHLAVAAPSTRRSFLALTAGTVLLAMYITRTGLSPLHSFAAPSIGALILLAGGLAGLAGFLYYFSTAAATAARELLGSLRKNLYLFGVALASLSLAAAAFFVYATMLVPSILTALGHDVSVPQMSSGIAYFHPVLYPLAILFLAALPASFFSDRYGWRGYAALVVSTAMVSLVVGLAAYEELLQLAPLSPRETNALMAAGTVWAALGVAVTGAYLASRLRRPLSLLRDRLAGVSLLHMGMALTLLGVLLSGTYAYNQQYFYDISLRPGEVVEIPGGYRLSLESYEYRISNATVDIYTQYVGRAETYYLAWMGLNTLAVDLGDMVAALKEYQEKASREPVLALAADLALSGEERVDRVEANISRLIQRDLASNATLLLPPAGKDTVPRLVAVNATLWFNARPLSSQDGRLVATGLQLVARTDRLVVEGVVGAASQNLSEIPSFHTVYEATLEKPVAIHVGSVRIEVANMTILPAAVVEGTEAGRVLANASMIVFENAYILVNGRAAMGNESLELPAVLDRGLMVYLYYRETRDPYLETILNSSLAEILEDPHALIALTHSAQCLSAGSCEGYVDAPRLVPESAWLDLKIRVEGPGGAETRTARLRFEAYGEIQGIHGLVPQVIRVLRGVDEVYIVVHVPVVPGAGDVKPSFGFHELLVYYLHEAGKNLSPRERLALAALMAAGYTIDDMRRLLRESPGTATYLLEKSIIDLYLLAEHYDPGHSVVEEKGVLVQVKVIPGALLVFLGPALMALGELLALAAIAATHRRPRES